MSVKIFLPEKLFYSKENCDIYGEIHINDNNSVSYFVVTSSICKQFNLACNELRHLGNISAAATKTRRQQCQDVALSFCYDADTANIYLDTLSTKPTNTTHANVFLYDCNKLLQLHCEPIKLKTIFAGGGGDCSNAAHAEQYDDVRMLFHLLQRYRRLQHSVSRPGAIVGATLNFPLEVINKIFLLLIECKPILFVVKRTVFYEHYLDWSKLRATGSRKQNFVMDKLLGICFMLIMLLYISQPGEHLIQSSHFVIKQLRLLLDALKGSPIGLKLNVHLNNFFLDCFNYHIDLWATFINIIEPAVRQLFVPIALLGFMGLSYQLAMLADLLTVIGLHAHCFYIYAAVLYKVEIKGLQVLWKVVLGKRRNLLKNRVESHNYMNRQLYLATIFFTTLLFLFPTILVYYVVFTTLRLCICFVHAVLRVTRRRILEFPLVIFLKWLSGCFYEIDCLQLQHKAHVQAPRPKCLSMSLFVIQVQSSSMGRVFSCESGVLQEMTTHEKLSWSGIVHRILNGKF